MGDGLDPLTGDEPKSQNYLHNNRSPYRRPTPKMIVCDTTNPHGWGKHLINLVRTAQAHEILNGSLVLIARDDYETLARDHNRDLERLREMDQYAIPKPRATPYPPLPGGLDKVKEKTEKTEETVEKTTEEVTTEDGTEAKATETATDSKPSDELIEIVSDQTPQTPAPKKLTEKLIPMTPMPAITEEDMAAALGRRKGQAYPSKNALPDFLARASTYAKQVYGQSVLPETPMGRNAISDMHQLSVERMGLAQRQSAQASVVEHHGLKSSKAGDDLLDELLKKDDFLWINKITGVPQTQEMHQYRLLLFEAMEKSLADQEYLLDGIPRGGVRELYDKIMSISQPVDRLVSRTAFQEFYAYTKERGMNFELWKSGLLKL